MLWILELVLKICYVITVPVRGSVAPCICALSTLLATWNLSAKQEQRWMSTKSYSTENPYLFAVDLMENKIGLSGSWKCRFRTWVYRTWSRVLPVSIKNLLNTSSRIKTRENYGINEPVFEKLKKNRIKPGKFYLSQYYLHCFIHSLASLG